MFIQLGGHRGGKRYIEPIFAEIDDEDFDKVSQYTWSQNITSNPNTIYAQTRTNGRKIHLHRLIMGLGDYSVDKRIINHIDGNGLNNKKSNLEVCDICYNSQSIRRIGNKGSIEYDNSNNRKKCWRAKIVINKVQTRKRFFTREEAEQFIQTVLYPE